MLFKYPNTVLSYRLIVLTQITRVYTQASETHNSIFIVRVSVAR